MRDAEREVAFYRFVAPLMDDLPMLVRCYAATFDPGELSRLARKMDVVHEDWRKTHKVYFSGEELAARLREVDADVLIVEADLVHEEVIDGCDLKIIGAARGDPINIGIEHATKRRIPVFFAPARNAQAVAELTIGFLLSLLRHVHGGPL